MKWSAFLWILLLSSAAFAQLSKDAIKFLKGMKDPVTAIFRGEMRMTGDRFVELAELMPAEKYGYRPTPQQDTFAVLLVRIIEQNYDYCSHTTGTDKPKVEVLRGTDPKTKIVAALRSSFQYCKSSFASLHDRQLGEVVNLSGEMYAERAGGLYMLLDGWQYQLGVMSVYLELNDLKP